MHPAWLINTLTKAVEKRIEPNQCLIRNPQWCDGYIQQIGRIAQTVLELTQSLQTSSQLPATPLVIALAHRPACPVLCSQKISPRNPDSLPSIKTLHKS